MRGAIFPVLTVAVQKIDEVIPIKGWLFDKAGAKLFGSSKLVNLDSEGKCQPIRLPILAPAHMVA